MRDTKAFASLSSGLLARKGQARPAMRPQGFAHEAAPSDDLGWNDMGHDAPRIAGARLPGGLAGPQAAPPEVRRQQDEIAREFAAQSTDEFVPVAPPTLALVAPVTSPEPVERNGADEAPVAAEAAVGARPPRMSRARRAARSDVPLVAPLAAGRKAAFTLRLEAERHLRLRLACAVQGRSAQQIVTEALDRMLDELPDVARLADSLASTD